MNAATQQDTFRVIVNISDMLNDVLNATQQTGKTAGNALHRFLEGTQNLDSALVYAKMEEASKQGAKWSKPRISEVKAVYTAEHHGLEFLDGDKPIEAYQDMVKAARSFLKDKGLMPNGNARKSEEESAKDTENRFLSKAIKDFLDQGKGAKEAAELAEGAWQVEKVRREGVPQDTVDELAISYLDNLIGDGFDIKTVRRVANRMLELCREADAAKKAAEEGNKSLTL